MQRRNPGYGTKRVVRGQADACGFGHGGDLFGLGQPAGMADIRLGDVKRPRGQRRSESAAPDQTFARSDGNGRGSRDFGQTCHIFGRDRLFDKHQPRIPQSRDIGIGCGDPAAGYSVRHHGLTVRATAVAQAVPARTVGPVQFVAAQSRETDVEGLTPFALSRTFWAGMGNGTVELTADAAGALTANGGAAGQAIDATRLLTVGQRLTDRSTLVTTFPADAPLELLALVPIYDTVAGRGEWFVGFGVVSVTSTAPLTIQRRAGGTAFAADNPYLARAGKPFRNVSGAVVQTAASALPADAPLDAVFTLNKALASDPATAPLTVTAPVLVR